jgi:ferredoxin-NADP reductase
MARAALPGRLNWHAATVTELSTETARVRSIGLELPDWPGHRAGQHVDVRLTADDGYQAQRSYSIASAPAAGHLLLTVERLDDGEVSPYLVDELRVGDELELRGPIGGYFVWEEAMAGPVLLVGGGSGVVPLQSIVRHHRAIASRVAMRLLYSARTLADVLYREELDVGRTQAAQISRPAAGSDVEVTLTLTRESPAGWTGYARRIDRDLLAAVGWPPEDRPLVYICGPNGFVETAAELLVDLGHQPDRIRTERFGPTGN